MQACRRPYKDIGKALNLSHTTVSRVLNGRNDPFISDATRTRVQATARQMGYRPHQVARALATGRTHQVAVWMRNMSSAYDAQVMRNLLLQLHTDAYQAVIGVADLCRAPETAEAEVEQMTCLAWDFPRRRIAAAELPPQQTLLQAHLVVRASTQRGTADGRERLTPLLSMPMHRHLSTAQSGRQQRFLRRPRQIDERRFYGRDPPCRPQ